MGQGKFYNVGFLSSNSISGGSFLTGDLTINANTISGLIDPTWPSSAASKHYVDTISGNLDGKIDAIDVTGSPYWSSQANKSAGSIYYGAGEVVIAPSGTDYGDYRLQV